MADTPSPEDDDALNLPPPYTEAPDTSPGTSTGLPVPAALADTVTSPLATHLRTLLSHVHAVQQARCTEQARRDLMLVTALVPYVETFLCDDLGRRGIVPPLAELVLVPAAAVPSGWELSGAVERRREGEIVCMARVAIEKINDEGKDVLRNKTRVEGNLDKDGDQVPGRNVDLEFDSWGRWGEDALAANSFSRHDNHDRNVPFAWWHDEALARRLAKYLEPKTALPPVDRQHVHAVVEQAREEKKRGWTWGRRKTTGSTNADAASTSAPSTPSQPHPAAGVPSVVKGTPKHYKTNDSSAADDRISMTAKAEDVTFRRENEFGLWESLTGIGIMVQVRVQQRSRSLAVG